MKKIIIAVIIIMAFVSTSSAKHGVETTETFNVSGSCKMCKKRIENALKLSGIRAASWSIRNKAITVIYDNDAISLNDIHKKIADTGHETEKLKADNEAYNELPECCYYERRK